MSAKSVVSMQSRFSSNLSLSKHNNFQPNPIKNPSNFSILSRHPKSNSISSSQVLLKTDPASLNSPSLEIKRGKTFLSKLLLTENQLTHSSSTEIEIEIPQNELHKTSESLSQTSIDLSDFPKSEKIKASPIRLSIATYHKVTSLSFDSAFQRFKILKLDLIPEKLWKKSFFKKISQCWNRNKLEDENLEMAERVIKFGLTKFNKNDFFHLSLVKGVQDSFGERVKVKGREVLEIAENRCRFPLVGLMNLLFFQDYFGSQMELLLEKFDSVKSALVFLLWISDIAFTIFRKEKLNKLINQCRKCFEVFCFFYAGLVIRAVERGEFKFLNYGSLYKKVNEFVRGSVFKVLKVAEELYE